MNNSLDKSSGPDFDCAAIESDTGIHYPEWYEKGPVNVISSSVRLEDARCSILAMDLSYGNFCPAVSILYFHSNIPISFKIHHFLGSLCLSILWKCNAFHPGKIEGVRCVLLMLYMAECLRLVPVKQASSSHYLTVYNIFFFLPVFPITFFCLFSSFLRWELKCSYAMSRMQDQWLVLFLPSAILLASFHKSSIFSPTVLKKSDIIIMKMFCHM